jgi:site-specific recombinase XerD
MPDVSTYIRAATRENTRKSYRAAVEHFEMSWGGVLPATADSIATYLVHYAPTLAITTLKQRLAAIAAWHNEQGFPDPTKAPHVKKVLKGIAQLHPHKEKQAAPFQLSHITVIDEWINEQISNPEGSPHHKLKLLRDRALILLGFWRALRSDELTRISVKDARFEADHGLELYLPRSKTDSSGKGQYIQVPALARLCPVSAVSQWISKAQLQDGALFCSVNQWGHISDKAMSPSSISSILRSYCKNTGLNNAKGFSSHSLRRGFSTWATRNGWDTKSLMEYVGWKDVKSALRYVDQEYDSAQKRISSALLSDASG